MSPTVAYLSCLCKSASEGSKGLRAKDPWKSALTHSAHWRCGSQSPEEGEALALVEPIPVYSYMYSILIDEVFAPSLNPAFCNSELRLISHLS